MRKAALVILPVLASAASVGYLYHDRLASMQRFEWKPVPRAEAPAPATAVPPTAKLATSHEASPSAERAAPAPLSPQAKLEEDAQSYVRELTQTDPQPVPVDHADHFVHANQQLAMIPKDLVESTTFGRLLRQPGITPDTPITVVHQAQQIERETPERLIAEAAGNLDRQVRVLTGKTVTKKTVRAVIEEHIAHPHVPIIVVKGVDYYVKTTPRELARKHSLTADTPMRVITKPYAMQVTTPGELMAGRDGVDASSIFYVRTVRRSDTQGIWGIIRDGLIQNFARGMAIRRGRTIDTYRVTIPRYADSKLADNSSSFLGKLIYYKALETYVYNFAQRRMQKNPNLIKPGQEILIVAFQPAELVAIYKHFVSEGG